MAFREVGQTSFFQSRMKVLKRSDLLIHPDGCGSSSGRWDGGLGHGQLLSQIVEASNVVHAALAHHAGKLRVHLQPKQDDKCLL